RIDPDRAATGRCSSPRNPRSLLAVHTEQGAPAGGETTPGISWFVRWKMPDVRPRWGAGTGSREVGDPTLYGLMHARRAPRRLKQSASVTADREGRHFPS